jgi:allophanate hydrolase subunit 2
MPLGGAFDRASAELANALLGNSPDCAVLELTLAGGVYQAEGPMALALAGAPIEAKVVDLDSTEHVLEIPVSFSLKDRQRLVLGRTLAGARTYLAVKHGFQTRLSLGSRSSEQPIRSGEVLPANAGTTPTRRPGEPAWRFEASPQIHIIEGPDGRLRSEFDDAFRRSRRFRVGSRSDRMGLRLEGEPVPAPFAPDRLSSPVAPGAIQVAGGQLIVLGIACGTMGGYPHIAHVISADLDRLGQLKPGDFVTFHRVSIEEARRRDEDARRHRRALLQRLATLAQGA